MTVIINDFEVVLDNETEAAPSGPAPVTRETESPATASWSPFDLDRVLRHRADRLDRVRAH